jgi:hypothetical protein
MFFMGSPSDVYWKYAQYPAALTPHRFAEKDKERLLPNGFYNVGYTAISKFGQKFIDEWSEETLRWCYNRNQDGLFGDQASLDKIGPQNGAADILELGVNLGPWSQAQYSYGKEDDIIYISGGGRTDELVCFHMHELQHNKEGAITKRTGWELNPDVVRWVYEPYEALIKCVAKEINITD